MSKSQPLDLDALAKTYKSLVSETDTLLRRQRQRGNEYTFRDGPGRPAVLEATLKSGSAPGSLPLIEATFGASARGKDGKKAPPTSPMRATKPAKTSRGAGDDIGRLLAASTANTDLGDMEDYDPRVVAKREHDALVAAVSAMRTEASRLHHNVAVAAKNYEKLRVTLAQLAYEDDVEEERAAGVAAMRELQSRIQYLNTTLSDTDAYEKTLGHMVKRGSDEKLSHLATLKAFEEALAVQRAELDLADSVLRQVLRSRDAETHELHRMQGEVKKQLSVLDRKLEARRLEVKARQEKARWRVAKLQEEMSLKAQAEGDLTEEEERAMIERAKNLADEARALREEKIRMQAEADEAEQAFHRLRFAAGVPGPTLEELEAQQAAAGADEDKEEGMTFVPPEPEPIIARFGALEGEVKGIEAQLRDYNERITVLQGQLAALQSAAQPKARDAGDEADVDVAVITRLSERGEAARRALETAQREFDEARTLRLQMEQSVAVLAERLAMIPSHVFAQAVASTSAHASDEDVSAAENRAKEVLAADSEALPSAWARALHAKVVLATTRLLQLMRAIDPASAAAALMTGVDKLASTTTEGAATVLDHLEAAGGHRGGADSGSAASGGFRPSARDGKEGEDEAGGSSKEQDHDQDDTAAGIGSDGEEDMDAAERALEATIESLVVANEWSIRVRPTSGGGPGSGLAARPTRAITSKALSDAVQAFERTWRDVGSGALPLPDAYVPATHKAPAQSGGTGPLDPFSKEASQRRRRASRVDIEAALAAAAERAGDHDDAGGLMSGVAAPPAGGAAAMAAPASAGSPAKTDAPPSAGASGTHSARTGRRAGGDGKPRARDVQRFLAVAASMVGDEVDEALISSSAGGSSAAAAAAANKAREAEDVPTRDRLKRSTKVQLMLMSSGKVGKEAEGKEGGKDDKGKK